MVFTNEFKQKIIELTKTMFQTLVTCIRNVFYTNLTLLMTSLLAKLLYSSWHLSIHSLHLTSRQYLN